MFLIKEGELEFETTFEVDKKGQINIPEVGQFQVGNKTAPLRTALRENYVVPNLKANCGS